ncbi:DUF2085 domain-containing protein [Bacteroidota bacterium]
MRLLARIIILFFLAAWVLGIFVLPLIRVSENFTFLIPFLKILYSNVCHQHDHKLLVVAGYPTLVCARCTGIYLGALSLGMLFIFIDYYKYIKSKYLYIICGIILVDILLYNMDVYNYSHSIALVTGFLLGSLIISYLYLRLDKIIK